jgi:hypothetical protein
MAVRRVNWLVKRIAKEGRRSAARHFLQLANRRLTQY